MLEETLWNDHSALLVRTDRKHAFYTIASLARQVSFKAIIAETVPAIWQESTLRDIVVTETHWAQDFSLCLDRGVAELKPECLLDVIRVLTEILDSQVMVPFILEKHSSG